MRTVAAVALFQVEAWNLPERTRGNYENPQDSCCPSQDSNKAPPIYKSQTNPTSR